VSSYLKIGEDNVIRWRRMTNSISGELIQGATVTCVLTDSNGNTVATITLAETYSQSGLYGDYAGVLDADDSATLTAGGVYTATITATKSGIEGKRVVNYRAKNHGART